MPAAMQASRSSSNALAVSATIGVRGAARLGLADPASRFDAVGARHVHVHQHDRIGLAGFARREPGVDGGVAAGRDGRAVPEPREQ